MAKRTKIATKCNPLNVLCHRSLCSLCSLRGFAVYLGAFVHALLSRAYLIVSYSCAVGKHAAACLCRTCQVDAYSLMLQQWPGPNDDQPYRRIIFRNISRNTEKKISCFHTQKGFDLWGTKSHHWHQIPGLFTPRPHWRTSQTPLLHARPVFRGGYGG